MSIPSAFDLEAFQQLAPDWQDRILYFPTIDSTIQEARRQLETASPREMLLVSDKQTAGRGRLNRSWQAPFASGLLCTLTLPLAPVPLDRAYLYTAAIALSLQKAALYEINQTLSLKWPNDLLRDGRKCCGILAEIEPVKNTLWLILGFGLNTALTDRDFLEAGLQDKATNVTPHPETLNREALLAATLQFWTEYRTQLVTNPESVRQTWAETLVTVGQEVNVQNLEGRVVLRGQAVGVVPNGGLLIRDEEGHTYTVQAGDVSVRLADGRYA